MRPIPPASFLCCIKIQKQAQKYFLQIYLFLLADLFEAKVQVYLLIAISLSVRRMLVDAQKVGGRIQEVRKSRGLTQAELSQMVDLSTKYISNIECGFKTPKLNTFVAIANALQCDANLLLSDVLDVSTAQESGLISKRLLALPVEEQRRILRVLEVMIEESAGK